MLRKTLRKTALHQGYFPRNFLKISRPNFPRNTFGLLLVIKPSQNKPSKILNGKTETCFTQQSVASALISDVILLFSSWNLENNTSQNFFSKNEKIFTLIHFDLYFYILIFLSQSYWPICINFVRSLWQKYCNEELHQKETKIYNWKRKIIFLE